MMQIGLGKNKKIMKINRREKKELRKTTRDIQQENKNTILRNIDNMCNIDTGSPVHMTHRQDWLVNYSDVINETNFFGKGGENSIIKIEGTGFLPIKKGNNEVILVKAFYTPEEDETVISAEALREQTRYSLDKDYNFLGNEVRKIETYKMDRTIWVAANDLLDHSRKGNSSRVRYLTSVNPVKEKTRIEQNEAHIRLNHVPVEVIEKTIKEGLFDDVEELDKKDKKECIICMSGRMKKHSHYKGSMDHYTKLKNPGSSWSLDIFGPVKTRHPSTDRYMLVMVDNVSKYLMVSTHKTKDANVIVNQIRLNINYIEKQFGRIVQELIMDRGSEFMNKDLEEITIEKGIQRRYTSTKDSAANGRAEAYIKTIITDVKIVLQQVKVSNRFWNYAARLSADVRNCIYNKKTGTSPIKMISEYPIITNLRSFLPFGSKALIWNYDSNKLQPKTLAAITLSHDQLGFGHYFYVPKLNKIIATTNYKILNSSDQHEESEITTNLFNKEVAHHIGDFGVSNDGDAECDINLTDIDSDGDSDIYEHDFGSKNDINNVVNATEVEQVMDTNDMLNDVDMADHAKNTSLSDTEQSIKSNQLSDDIEEEVADNIIPETISDNRDDRESSDTTKSQTANNIGAQDIIHEKTILDDDEEEDIIEGIDPNNIDHEALTEKIVIPPSKIISDVDEKIEALSSNEQQFEEENKYDRGDILNKNMSSLNMPRKRTRQEDGQKIPEYQGKKRTRIRRIKYVLPKRNWITQYKVRSIMYNDAIKRNKNIAERIGFQAAMKKELDNLIKMKVFDTHIKIPKEKIETKKIIRSNMIFTKKRDGTYKARAVARGDQQDWTTYGDIETSILDIESLKLALIIANNLKLRIRTADISHAFLYAPIKEELYLQHPFDKNMVTPLNKSLYGLKQSPKNWNEHLKEYLNDMGFEDNEYSPGFFMSKDKRSFVTAYVDDCIIAAPTENDIDRILNRLQNRFEVKEVGVAKNDVLETDLLGIDVKYDYKNGRIELKMEKYIESIEEQYKDFIHKPAKIPHLQEYNIIPDKENLEMELKEYKEKVKYLQKIIGQLNYIRGRGRIDIEFSLGKLARLVLYPHKKVIDAAHKLLRYIYTTKHYPIIFRRENPKQSIYMMCDASLGTEYDLKSRSGGLVWYGNNLITGFSKKSAFVCDSPAEAELDAMKKVEKLGALIRTKIRKLNSKLLSDETDIIFTDSQTIIDWLKQSYVKGRTKFISINTAYIKERIDNKTLKIIKIDGKKNLTDPLTKSTVAEEVNKLVSSMNNTTNPNKLLDMVDYEL